MAASSDHLKSLFCEALDRPAGPERSAYLDGACRSDARLRAQVEELLAAHDRAGRFLAAGPSGTATTPDGSDPATVAPTLDAVGSPEPDRAETRDATAPATSPATLAPDAPGPRPITEGPGSRIGPYKLLQKIGEGGMGAVYMAEQERPVRRRVALKIIKAGMDSAQVVARFEAERQALALMDHPNIARVLDAGATDTGRPFFVMELVNGAPITDYCDEARLSPRERLELFVPVCQAVQHAHQKGIIHRDIKPSNVLVTLIDGRPVPKVIDFGVAKATDQRLTEKTLFTQFGSIVGTLEYMSPEQADLSGLDVDTRADVYSLGVLLYELLTGGTPLGRARLREAGYAEILRRIREEEPPRPSTRLSSSGDRLASIAATRGTEPQRLARAMRGELDWIAMKALEKDRTRRYETANGLARDVRRYLDGDAVEAGPPGAGYRLRRFARRHRGALATAGAFAALLVIGAAVSLALAVRATRAERETRRAAQDARDERDRALRAEARARTEAEHARRAEARARDEADKAKAVNDFLTTDLLAQAEPEMNAPEDHVTLLEVVDRAAAQVGERFRSQPEVEEALRRTIAETYHGLGAWGKAERQWRAILESTRRRLGPESAASYLAQSELAHILGHQWYPAAEVLEMTRSAAAGLERSLGPDHPDTLASRDNLATAYSHAGRDAEAISLLEATTRTREASLGPDHRDTLAIREVLAAYRAAGRTAEAIRLYEPILKARASTLGPDHLKTLATCVHLGAAYVDAGRPIEAIALLEPALKSLESKFGARFHETLHGYDALARADLDAGRVADAIRLREARLKAFEATQGPDDPAVLAGRNDLAVAYLAAGRTAEAIRLHEAVLRAYESRHGREDPQVDTCRNHLAVAYLGAGRSAEAIALMEPILKARVSRLGPDHPETLTTRENLGVAYRAAGRIAEAIALLESVMRAFEATLGPGHPKAIVCAHQLGHALAAAQPARAEPLFRRALAHYQRTQGPGGPLTLDLTRDLADLLFRTDRAAEAAPLIEEALRACESKLGPDHPETATYAHILGHALVDTQPARAEPLFRRALAHYRRTQGPGGPLTLDLTRDLARLLAGTGRAAEDVPLIEAAPRVQEARTGGDDPSRLALRIALASAYEHLGRWADAEPLWRAALAQVRRSKGRATPSPDGILAALGWNRLRQGEGSEAEPLLREALTIRTKAIPDNWLRSNAMSLLGGALLAQGRYAEAEPLVVAGYEGLKAREAAIPTTARMRLPEAAERVVALYRAWGRTEPADAWARRLGLADLPADVFAPPAGL